MPDNLLDSTIFFIISVYFIASLMTFIIYALDKSAAKKGKWRIKENTLHFMSLAGGWPGALIAQKMLRHKSIKQPFRFIFWLTVIVNVGILISSLLTEMGENALYAWVSVAIKSGAF